jgi:hypothetical protein
MTTFARQFDVAAAVRARDPWFLDLLRLWRPSGVEAGELGLRLAVRNGYLNFYHLGQSIALIRVQQRGALTRELHWKYVWPGMDPPAASAYAVQRGDSVQLSGMPALTYQGPQTLTAWIQTAKGYVGAEKRHVEQMVAGSANVMDLEMGHPGTALRIDLVGVEEDSAGLWLRCVEVKRSRDSRVRSKGPRPEVIDQLEAYANYLSSPENSNAMASAYAETARVLVSLAELAAEAGNPVQLSDLLVRACSEPLRVRPRVTLAVVVDEGDANWSAIHVGKLRASDVDVREVHWN